VYTIITENDVSEWDDRTGEQYHFPSRYLKYLQPGTKVIYYKGSLKNKVYRNSRLSDNPHYFGIAEIESIEKDPASQKNDYYAKIKNYQNFNKPVYAKDENGKTIEIIPESRLSNYWRDGVREINKEIYNQIIELSDLSDSHPDLQLNDDAPDGFTSTITEGAKRTTYTTTYERNPKLKRQALKIHGYSCMACGFNFEKVYGEYGKGYIHVHHTKPVATSGERTPDPETEMIVLCANCHAMVHRRKNKVLTLEELKDLMKK